LGVKLTMALAPGTRLGAFEITGPLGVGGMGEVYRAADTKLGREVAIKTLPASLAGEKDRLARFEREAKLLAALNHAHIGSIYSLDEHEDTLYLAMELVEGETLEEKLKGGALPVDDALRLALQIAEALEAAHEKGVVHRDLKPANIMVTPDGVVKVLDFGLAKAFSGDPNMASPAHSPALSLAMTQAGLVLGTAGYMAPEQASGQATDQRADIWAFGVVLYEMLTGLPLFSGESVPHILADVLRAEPEWGRLPTPLHPRLKLLLERCLAKKPRDRLHSIADARIELEAVLGDPAGARSATPAGPAAPKSSSTLRIVAAALILAILAGAAGWFARPVPAPGPVVRFSVPLGEGQTFTNPPASMIALSPDGTRIAYLADGQIYLRNLGETEARPVPGTAESGGGPATPAFSPDGQWLAYVQVVSATGPFIAKRVPISGGAPVPIYEGESVQSFPFGLTWASADTILFANRDGIVRMPANGGATEVLVTRNEDERFFSPQLLPDGQTLLFTALSGAPGSPGNYDMAQIVVQSIGANDRTVVWDGGSAARYLTSGHLVYAQGTALFAIAFDPDTRAVRGGPVPMVQGLRRSSNAVTDAANVAISNTGALALIPGNENAGSGERIETTLTWVDRNGREEAFPVRPDDYTAARISPDGTKVALVVGANLVRDSAPAIWIFDRRTENLSLLTSDPAGDDGPVWSSDGSRIFFRSLRGDSAGVYAIELDTGETTLIADSMPDFPNPMPWSISPRDETLALVSAASLEDINVAALSVANGEFSRLLYAEGTQSEPSISPDGAWVAYQQDSGSGLEVNIRPFPDVSRTRIPVSPGEQAVFSRDGTELFFFDGRGLAVAAVAYEPALRVGTPDRLFETANYLTGVLGRAWDPDPSGERFLLIRQPSVDEVGQESPRLRIDVALNWIEELKQRVPTD
jgi:Tol biopolymer transport system component